MKTKKRLSPFAQLTKEIESELMDISLKMQLHSINDTEDMLDSSYILGQVSAYRHMLELAYSISYNRTIGTVMDSYPEYFDIESFLQRFQAATKKEE